MIMQIAILLTKAYSCYAIKTNEKYYHRVVLVFIDGSERSRPTGTSIFNLQCLRLLLAESSHPTKKIPEGNSNDP